MPAKIAGYLTPAVWVSRAMAIHEQLGFYSTPIAVPLSGNGPNTTLLERRQRYALHGYLTHLPIGFSTVNRNELRSNHINRLHIAHFGCNLRLRKQRRFDPGVELICARSVAKSGC